MAASQKMKGASERAKKAAAGEKTRLEKAAHKAKSFAEEHGEEARERVSQARKHAAGSKGK